VSGGGTGEALGLKLLVAATRAELRARARLQDPDPVTSFYRHAARTVPRHAAYPVRAELAPETLPLTSREDLARHPRACISGAFDASEFRWRQTSGTSGVPLRVPRDPASEYIFTYDTYRVLFSWFAELRGRARAGEVAVVQINDNPTRTDAVGANPALGYANVVQLVIGRGPWPDMAAAQMALEARPALLTGRPRALGAFGELVEKLDRWGPETRLAAIVCSGDNLYPDTRRSLARIFGVPVYNAYASREAGLVALECENGALHAVDGRAAIEVLPSDASRPAPEGEGELIVTAYENWALPLIRYRTGDHARVCAGPCTCGRSGASITELSGRDSTYFTIDGRRVNPSVFSEPFEELPLRQFQLRQVGPRAFVFRWLANGDVGAEVDELVRSTVVRTVGSAGRATVEVSRVTQIGTRGEKVQRFVREQRLGRS
jgi:phenylacetate-coenzyme A ligase PaaK-like adenylate-forming protein